MTSTTHSHLGTATLAKRGGLAVAASLPGSTAASIVTLMARHLVVAAVCDAVPTGRALGSPARSGTGAGAG